MNATQRSRTARSRERGSALIAVVLVALVLTVVGLGIAFFASTEDQTSGNTKMSRVGFYAAEAGLREAEVAVTAFAQENSGNASALLALPTDPDDVYTPPGGGRPAYLLRLPNRNFRNVVLAQGLGDASTRAMYSVFVRNNAEDTTGGNNSDSDRRVNLVVVGQMVQVDGSGNPVLDGNGNPTIGITKILEEQLQTNAEGSAAATQKGSNVGGTSSGAK
jgi:hypothetical protein